jgi:hypothetical protein
MKFVNVHKQLIQLSRSIAINNMDALRSICGSQDDGYEDLYLLVKKKQCGR